MSTADVWVQGAPSHWTRGRLKDMITFAVNGVWGDEPIGDGTDVYCVRAADFNRTRQRVSTRRLPLRSIDHRTLGQHLLRPGDLILEKSGGGDLQPVGMAVIFDLAEPAVCSNFCSRLIPERHVDSRFLAYALATAYGQGLTQSATKQTTGIQNLDSGALFASSWAYPDLNEQCRIADFLDAETALIERLVAARAQQLVYLDERSNAEVSEILLPGSTSPRGGWSLGWLPDLPVDRPLVRLGYVCRLQNGLTVDSNRDVSGDVITRPYLRVANVQSGYVRLDSVVEVTVPRKIAERSTLRPGDVLMTEGGDLDKLGRGTVWRGELPGCLHQNHVFALRPEVDRLDGDYLALMTQTIHGRCYFESTGSKTTNLASTNSSKILSFPIPLPGTALQRQLVATVRQGLEVVALAKKRLNRQLVLLAERRRALIAAAVTGYIDVSTAGRRIED